MTKHDLKLSLAQRIAEEMKDRRMSQTATATLIGISQPRVSDIVNLRLDRFSVDSLLDVALGLGVLVRVRF